ncbi:MAG: EamA family transporter [Ardenticatenales bacterium]|nr:EamA family transporter [Ardenticatenales bacterium]
MFAIGTVGFQVLAITNTTVANTLIIVNTTPVFAALFAWLFLNERVSPRTWLVIGLVLLSIVYVALVGGPAGGRLLGNLAPWSPPWPWPLASPLPAATKSETWSPRWRWAAF